MAEANAEMQTKRIAELERLLATAKDQTQRDCVGIVQMADRIAELEAALAPFAAVADYVGPIAVTAARKDFVRARDVLTAKEP